MARARPCVFVGSSSEGEKIAKWLQVLLAKPCEVVTWSQGVFGLGQVPVEALVLALDEYDFAILVLTPEDLVVSRGSSSPAPRDDVLFELRLLMGALGRNRTFIVYDRTAGLKLPSDLGGVSAATFALHASGNLESALGETATRIEAQIERFGFRDRERLKQLSEAAQEFDNATVQMHKLVELIARSRKVELDIISSQFGPLIAPDKSHQMHQDLLDLEPTLKRKDC
jgi:hypothetical protein